MMTFRWCCKTSSIKFTGDRMNDIIGRQSELKILDKLYRSKKAEFLAIYGRRRIGKTFLITHFFKDSNIYFEVTGSKRASKSEQLFNFHHEFVALFEPETDHSLPPKNWSEAFHKLKDTLSKINPSQRIILFFDELPWLATPKSGFLSALEYFWNRHASRMPNILLIVCGSAASWMLKKIIYDRGGLYGRLSAEIRLQPFSLSEVEQFFKARHIHLTRKQIVEVYMATGGIPKYLNDIERGQSSAQIINSLCFTPQSPLLTEFHKLFDSLFDHAYKHVKIVRALANKREGLTRKEIFAAVDSPAGGRSNELIDELEATGFITSIPMFGKEVRDRNYRLIDEYSLFYLIWIDSAKQSILQGKEEDYWGKIQMTPAWHTWAGYAFENICFKAIGKIKEALKIGGVATREWRWRHFPTKENEEGAEIDLVIDRADQCINLCEIKFYNGIYALTKSDAENLERKKRVFLEKTQTRKAIFMTLITPYGTKENDHYLSFVDRQLTLEDLF